MTNHNDEYYGSAEQCFWEGPCNDPACDYCRPRRPRKLSPREEMLAKMAFTLRLNDVFDAIDAKKKRETK
jgi:hypothetical protein